MSCVVPVHAVVVVSEALAVRGQQWKSTLVKSCQPWLTGHISTHSCKASHTKLLSISHNERTPNKIVFVLYKEWTLN